MLRLLHAELYKLRRQRFFWALLLLSGFLYAVLLLDSAAPASTRQLLDGLLYHAPLLGILLATFVALFIGSDFSDHTLQSYITSGHKRGHILGAKLLVMLLAAGLLLILPPLAALLIGQLIWADLTPALVRLLLEAALIVIPLSLLPALCAFVIKDVGKTLAVTLFLFILMVFLLNSGAAPMFSRLLPMGQLRLLALGRLPDLTPVIGPDLLWVILCLAGSYLAFRPADLK